jgi:hypothetical protein
MSELSDERERRRPTIHELRASAPQPEPDAGGEWRVVETRYSSEIAIGDNLRLRAQLGRNN